ncbi:MAG: hypothetical protein IKQ41_10390 [Clostridia bacterium]|nr:hypothetical protein [Clostridia bacterium]
MKKMLSLLLALLLLASPALAENVPEAEESPALTYEEMQIYLTKLVASALADPDLGTVVSLEEGGPMQAIFAGGSLQIAEETLTETTAVLGAELAMGQEDPRGLLIGASLDELLAAYPNDNPGLYGSYYDAALYVRGEQPEVTAGYLLRDGQRVTQVVHAVYFWQADEVICCRVRYEIRDGMVFAISIEDMDKLIPQEEALGQINEIAAIQENREYFAYPTDESGALEPFVREDLGLRTADLLGTDLLDLTPETALETLGEALGDAWSDDQTGAVPHALRQMDWEGISLLLVYDENRNEIHQKVLTVTSETLEGPRGVRVGDTMDSVLNRFRHALEMTGDGVFLLYGDGQQAPFGVLSYNAYGAEIQYALALEDGRTVRFHLSFTDGILDEMILTVV